MADVDDRKTPLIDQLRQARSRLSANGYELADDLNFPAKISSSLKKHRGIWLGAAALFGLLITQLPRRTKKVFVPAKGKKKEEVERAGIAAILLGVLKIALNVGKPLILAWASKRVKRAAEAEEARR
jgi:hypothetical protein